MAPLIQSRTVRNIAFDIQKKIADEISEFADDPTRIKAPRNRLVFDTCRTWRAGRTVPLQPLFVVGSSGLRILKRRHATSFAVKHTAAWCGCS